MEIETDREALAETSGVALILNLPGVLKALASRVRGTPSVESKDPNPEMRRDKV